MAPNPQTDQIVFKTSLLFNLLYPAIFVLIVSFVFKNVFMSVVSALICLVIYLVFKKPSYTLVSANKAGVVVTKDKVTKSLLWTEINSIHTTLISNNTGFDLWTQGKIYNIDPFLKTDDFEWAIVNWGHFKLVSDQFPFLMKAWLKTHDQ